MRRLVSGVTSLVVVAWVGYTVDGYGGRAICAPYSAAQLGKGRSTWALSGISSG